MRPRHIAFICPRYEIVSAGGAEVHAQKLAERVAGRGHRVEILTTCARDHYSWTNYYGPGRMTINGLPVWRFLVNRERKVQEFLAVQSRIDRREKVSIPEQRLWIDNSVNCLGMYDFIEKRRGEFDCFVFIPYLFGTTFNGAKVCPEKTLLIPCLHDETFAYLEIFKELFEGVRGIMFNTHPEIALAKRLFDLDESRYTHVSLGFESAAGYSAAAFREKHGIKGNYLLFVGRREAGKNVPLLIDYFSTYKKHNDNDLRLILLGTGEVDIDPRDIKNILDFGYLEEDDKTNCFAASMAFCQPSVNESLSIVLMEAWLSGTAVLVHGNCEVTRDHCERSNGGLFFTNYYEFEEALNFLIGNKQARDTMAANGQGYVRKEYNWEAVLDRFESSLEKFGL